MFSGNNGAKPIPPPRKPHFLMTQPELRQPSTPIATEPKRLNCYHYFKIKDNSQRVHEILKKNGVPTEYHVLKGKKYYDVHQGRPLDTVMKLEIVWFDK